MYRSAAGDDESSCQPRMGRRSRWPSIFWASPRLQRLFSHVHELGLINGELLSKRQLAVLCPPCPPVPSAFCGLRFLQVCASGCDLTSFFERLIPSSAAFPSLEQQQLHVVNQWGLWGTMRKHWTLDERTLAPLSRLMRLHRLELLLLRSIHAKRSAGHRHVEGGRMGEHLQ